jgi:diguanylate cyclase (GGDEF)-like protein/PAS domain S-box-containing protein
MPIKAERLHDFLPRSPTGVAATLAAASILTALAWIDSEPRFALAVPAGLWLLAHASVVLTVLVVVRGALVSERDPAADSRNADRAAGSEAAVHAVAAAGDARGLAALEELGDVVFTIDSAACWAFLNSAWERLSGIPVAETLGRPFLQSLHQDDRSRVQEHFDALRYDPNPRFCEARLRTGSGRYAYVEIRARRGTADYAGASIHGAIWDVSQRWAAEETLRRKRHLLNTMLNNLPGMAYRCRIARDWRMEFVSDGCFELTGYEAADLVGNRKVAYADLIHPADRDGVWQECQAELKHRLTHDLEYRIIARNGEVKWVWEQTRCVYSATGEPLAQEGYISDITLRKLAEQTAHRQFIWDEVTGLHNSVVFNAWLEFALAQAHSHHFACAVIALDLDDFGRWSRHNGRELGDRILEEVGRRLAALVRGANIAARLRGDEFAILVTDFAPWREAKDGAEVSHSTLAARVARCLQERIRRPMAFDGVAVQVTTSVGIAVAEGDPVGDAGAEGMLREAMDACVRAKFLRSGQLAFADPRQDNVVDGGRRIHTLLAGALGANALEICYQPVFSLATRQVAWWEPSLIWQHPRRGQLDLMEGYPALQTYPYLLTVITRWMIRETVQDRRLLPDVPQDDSLRVCVALPAECLEDRSVIDELMTSLDDRGIPPSRCTVSLGRLPQRPGDPIQLRDALVGLRRAGFLLVAEDPGSDAPAELSALAAICALHKVRVEHSQEALARISQRGGPASVACGISTEESLETALQSGCAFGQGALLGEPRSARVVAEAWLRRDSDNAPRAARDAAA